ncbi:hypothetical protein INT43_003503 [Umbelopsis isabellina]|uniref:ER membrane protein complex subunit 10 n=1 Tax=Mortierella isabellina TaxID=91625 RepID=A0A8H7UCU4_MORIS|nr:hypothetical protein INT43_003503 [Umbelopsis isabellina]
MKHIQALFAFIVLTICAVFADEANAVTEKPRLLVYHKLTAKGDYIKRGEISYATEHGEPKYTHTNSDNIELDISTPNSLYQIKVVEDGSKNTILSSIKACQLAASDFKDQFNVHVDEKGNFVHIDYYSQVSDCFEGAPSQSSEINSTVTVIHPDRPVRPLLAKLSSFGQKSQPAADGKEAEADVEPEEKTFFQKYWYILLAIAIMFVTSAGQEAPAAAAPARR